MRLYALTVPTADSEVVADRCWQAGAAGIWERYEAHGATVLRVGVDDVAADAFLAALGALGPVDVTDTEQVHLATRTVQVGGVTLQVPPTVFGDGEHPTTATCIDLVGELVAQGTRFLDVGCGSGALAVLAAFAGAEVVAVDVDPVAVDATVANAAANGVDVEASVTPLAEIGGRYDVVVANISAHAVLELADDLRRLCAPGGVIVPSGILAHRWEEVARALGGTVRDVRDVEGWVTAVVGALSATEPGTRAGLRNESHREL